MPQIVTITHANLKTPKAAAMAGIAFSALLITFFWLLRLSIPANPMASGAWIASRQSFHFSPLSRSSGFGRFIFGAAFLHRKRMSRDVPCTNVTAPATPALCTGPDFAILRNCMADNRLDSPDRQTMVTLINYRSRR